MEEVSIKLMKDEVLVLFEFFFRFFFSDVFSI